MVGRASDRPVGAVETIQDQDTRLTDVERGLGRGVEALRNAAGHLLRLANAARPLLVPTAGEKNVDVGLAFRDGGVEVRDPTDSSYRDFMARVINALGSIGTEGNVVAKGDVIAAKVRANIGGVNDGYQGYGQWHGGVSGDGAATQVDAGYVLSGGDMRANRDFNAGRSIAAAVNVFDGVGNLRTQSERALKDHLGDLDPDVVDRFAVGRFRFRADSGIATPRASFEMVPLDPDDENTEWVERPVLEWVPDDTEHVGLYVDDLDDADPALVRRGADGHRTFEDRGVLAYLTVAVQAARRENRELRARLDALDRAGQDTGSSAIRDQPPYPDHTGNAPGSSGA